MYIKHAVCILELVQSLTQMLFETSINDYLWTCPKLEELFSQTHAPPTTNHHIFLHLQTPAAPLGLQAFIYALTDTFSPPWTQILCKKHAEKKLC